VPSDKEELMSVAELREREYVKRLTVNALRREVYQQADPAASEGLLDALQKAEQELSVLERQRVEAQASDAQGDGLIIDTRPDTRAGQSHDVRGPQTTGLEARAVLRMAQLPTSIHHLLNRADHPLVSCTIRNVSDETRRLRVISFVEGYSAQAVDMVELPSDHEEELHQLPTLFPDRLREVNELTNATVNLKIEDLDGTIELHKTETVRLLARTAVPLAVMDPETGRWHDLSRYLGAFVTPNTPAIMSFLRRVADYHPDGRLIGYQGSREGVAPQVEAIFDALKAAGITYINSVVAFSPEEGAATQRVRLPRESLADQEANCIDGTVLVASLLEAISMSPAIVIVPGHAFVAWETWTDSDDWRYLETTMIGSSTFEQACASAEHTAHRYEQLRQQTDDPLRFRMWPLQKLRSADRITPME
jgi:hypothetical protein